MDNFLSELTREQLEWAAKVGLVPLVSGFLGGVVGAFFGLLSAWIARKHDFRRDRYKRKQELIEKISSDFTAVHQTILGLYVLYRSVLTPMVPEPRTEISIQLESLFIKEELERSADGVRKVIKTDIGPALLAIHGIEDRMRLLSDTAAVLAFQRYRESATNLQNAVSFDEKDAPSVGRWETLFSDCDANRDAIFKELNRAWAKP